MLSRGKFRYVRGLYRNIKQRRKLNELFGTPVTLSHAYLSNVVQLPLNPPGKVVCQEVDHSTPDSIPMYPLRMVTLFTKEGPGNVTYI